MPKAPKKLETIPHYPDLEVQLSGEDGNAFAILGRVSKAMRRFGIHDKEIKRFMEEARSGDYDNLLATCGKWVEIA